MGVLYEIKAITAKLSWSWLAWAELGNIPTEELLSKSGDAVQVSIGDLNEIE